LVAGRGSGARSRDFAQRVEGERRNNARLSWADAELAGVSRLQMTNVGVQSRFDVAKRA
jgi:hypothetical protein